MIAWTAIVSVQLQIEAPKGTPGDAKCVTEILGDKNNEGGGKIYLVNKCVDVYI